MALCLRDDFHRNPQLMMNFGYSIVRQILGPREITQIGFGMMLDTENARNWPLGIATREVST